MVVGKNGDEKNEWIGKKEIEETNIWREYVYV